MGLLTTSKLVALLSPGDIKMDPAVWAVTGIKRELFDSRRDKKTGPDLIIGKVRDTTYTIMHGETWNENTNSRGYAYLKVSLQKMEDFENTALAHRGVGAVSGGFTYTTGLSYYGGAPGKPVFSSPNSTSSKSCTPQHEWGVIDATTSHVLCGFYGEGSTYSHVMVCFGPTKVAAVLGFWRNGLAMVGPNTECDKTGWGLNIRSVSTKGNMEVGNFAVALDKARSTVLLRAVFPGLLAEKTVQPETTFSRVITNGSSATFEGNFATKTNLLDTHAFVFQKGSELDWSQEWKANVPILGRANTVAEIEVTFGAHQTCAPSKSQTIDLSAKVIVSPKTGCKATASYLKYVLTVNAVLTVRTTFSDGTVETREVPAKYTSVSCADVKINLEDIAVGPATV